MKDSNKSLRALTHSDEVNSAEFPSTYQVVWSASVCQLPSLQKRQGRRGSSSGIGHLGIYKSSIQNDVRVNQEHTEEFLPLPTIFRLSPEMS